MLFLGNLTHVGTVSCLRNPIKLSHMLWRNNFLCCLEQGGWVKTRRSPGLPPIVRLTLGQRLPRCFPSLFKETGLSFTNICLGDAYHQESNVELAPHCSALKPEGVISSLKGQRTGLAVLWAAPGDTKRHHA